MMTKDQAKQQIADAIANRTWFLSALGAQPVMNDDQIWRRCEQSDHLVSTWQMPTGHLEVQRIALEDVPDLADKWNHRGNRAARRKRAAIARKRN